LPRQGYARYEISNFALPGFESQHNLGYWQDVPYLGLGAAAHSYLEGQRYKNVADLVEYIENIKRGELPRRLEEETSVKTTMEEFCFLALRTAAGISRAAFKEKFGCPIEDIYAEPLQKLMEQKLLEMDEQRIHLTAQGAKMGNLVFEEFLLD